MTVEKQSAEQAELLFYVGSELLEGPVWDEKRQLIYCVSIDDHIIYRINPETTEVTSYLTDGPVGAAVLNSDGQLLSAEKSGIYRIDPDTKARTFLAHPSQDERLRYNDGKLDPKGRLLIGTMGEEDVIEGAASLFSIAADGSNNKELLSGLSIANGLGWSADGQIFYHIDTPTNKVRQYAYDLEEGTLSNERICVEVAGEGSPDGMCVGPDGTLWVAEFGGGKVCQWDPKTGDKLTEIALPATNVTSCCIGGKDMDYLLVTTARDGEGKEPLSGGLFRIKIS